MVWGLSLTGKFLDNISSKFLLFHSILLLVFQLHIYLLKLDYSLGVFCSGFFIVFWLCISVLEMSVDISASSLILFLSMSSLLMRLSKALFSVSIVLFF